MENKTLKFKNFSLIFDYENITDVGCVIVESQMSDTDVGCDEEFLKVDSLFVGLMPETDCCIGVDIRIGDAGMEDGSFLIWPVFCVTKERKIISAWECGVKANMDWFYNMCLPIASK